ncbi:uncharacterized protein LOC130559383 isoform X2 [Triplophysa rosa]|uniref:uncharacterized protein LOC130559383 isoform X2 n=1 Tax=Triplophysa rosa TaxID=992332 RepID=UPI002545BF2E|nr:uncharacterized protein LOC130559383 isoform X2 [Triplophysa rosa]
MEEDGKENAPEAEGAQAEEFTQDLSDFQKEDGKEHTRKKDIVQDEEYLKAEEGNKESEKPKEFRHDKVKNVDSKELKKVLKEKDGEKDAQEVEGAKEEDVTQEMTTFKKGDDKEHMSEKDLIQEEEDLTVDSAHEMKKGQQEEDVNNKDHRVEDSDSWSDTVDDVSLDREDKFFTESVPAPPSFFFIPQTAWETLRKKQKNDHFKGLQWTNVISSGIRTVHPYCSFAFTGHRVQIQGSTRYAPVFKCSGYCMFTDCPVEVEVVVHSEKTLKAHVSFRGDMSVHNKRELQRRPVRADAQKEVSQQLQTTLPRALYLQKMENLRESVVESGCRDEAPSPGVLKSISWRQRMKDRKHKNETLSLQMMVNEKRDEPDEVIQKVILHPKGVMLWSKKSIDIFHQRCKYDIVYLDATGSIVKKSEHSTGPFYIYELVVRNPNKGSSPFPAATYVTCDHTTSSIVYFLSAFQTDHAKQYGHKNIRPLMIICDGSMVLMHAISLVFCQTNLNALLQRYYRILTGKGTAEDFDVPVLHRCLSHIMKNAKSLCKKHAPKNYKLAMHIFGLLTTASTIAEFDEMLLSCTVIFSSPCSSENVEKHFNNIQALLTTIGDSVVDDNSIVPEHLEDTISQTPFHRHFMEVIGTAPLNKKGDPNVYYTETFISSLAAYFLPHAALWTSMMLGDLGRHGEGPPYQLFSKTFSKISKKKTQNFTQDNKTQGIMEKSQWDLKKIRFRGRRLNRLDDFIMIYKDTHTALLREFNDAERITKRKEHRILKEKWRQRKQSRRGVYVTSINKPFHFKKAVVTQTHFGYFSKTTFFKDISSFLVVFPKIKQVSTARGTTSTPSIDRQTPSVSAQEPKTESQDKDALGVSTAPGTTGTPSPDRQTPSVSAQEPKTESQDKKALKKGRKPLKAKRQKSYGPLWRHHSPEEVIQARKLVKEVVIKERQMLSILHPQTWLSSDEVDAACFHISQQFPHIDGFQSNLLYQCLHQGGVVGTPQKPFVQVLNINDNHWITASNLFCGPNEVCVYDSLNTNITKQTDQKLSWLIRPQAPQFKIKKPAVQMQQSSSSCGFFALAFATVLCDGVKPEECQFQERNMRRTLYRALKNKKAPVFTYQPIQAKPERATVQVDVHCICRTSHNQEVMVQCSNCNNWYHPNCVSVPHKALDTTAEEWNCEICTN